MRHHRESRCTLQSVIAFSIIAVATLSARHAYAQAKSAQPTCRLEHTNLSSASDIRRIVMPAPAPGQLDTREPQCATECWNNSTCLAWTYVRPNTIEGPNGTCHLKASLEGGVSQPCCTSGRLAEPHTNRRLGDFKRLEDAPGAPITVRQCQAACFSEPNCKAWTFVKANTVHGAKNECYLKSSIPPPDRLATCCISGYFETQIFPIAAAGQ